MAGPAKYQSRFSTLRCCVLIPTYNNSRTLETVIYSVLEYTENLIVVNDGSTDTTKEILSKFPKINVLEHKKNQGKGAALRNGLKKAEHLGYEYAISMDSDGQHFADDLPRFLERLKKKFENAPELFLVGEREFDAPDVPQKNRSANRFSNYWFWVETGIQLNDTQCGFRLYPLKTVNNIRFYTTGFEFETEVLVKTAWRNVAVEQVPVKVKYAYAERMTHFRPVMDITRITLLHIWFVFVTFFFVKPKSKFLNFRKKGLKRFWREDVLKSVETPRQKAKAVSLGVFIGISPFLGLHTLLVFVSAKFLRLNKLIAFFFSNVSIPLFLPFIMYASYQTGALILDGGFDWSLGIGDVHNGKTFLLGFWRYFLGGLILASIVSLLSGIFFYFLFSIFGKR